MNKKNTIIIVNVGKHLGGAERVMFDLINNIDKDKFNNILVCCKNSLIHKKANKYNPQQIIVTVNSNRLLMFFDLFKLVRHSKKNNVQIIHCHGVLGSLLGSVIGFIAKINVITTIHSSTKDDFENKLKGKLYFHIENYLLKYNRKYVTVSKYLEMQLLKRGLNKDKIICIHNGIKYTKSTVCQDEIIRDIRNKGEGNILKIACIGRLEYVKGQDLLIDGLAKYKEINQDFFCWIIGEGSTKKELEINVKNNSLNKNIMITGYKNCIIEILEEVDLVIVPSRMEALSLVAIEALQHKCIVLATDAGGVSDVIENNVTGYLYYSEDIEDMKERIKCIHEQIAKLEYIKESGLERVMTEYSISNMIKNYKKIYEETLKLGHKKNTQRTNDFHPVN